ncbi:MAG: hypothetical protein WC505_06900 [Patescibacteria group bacterium]
MAIGDIRLTNSRYVRPGAYIGFVPQPSPVSPTGNPRYPCIVGRGSRLARVNAEQHVRARVYGEQLTFTSTAPYIAYLDNNANPDKGLTQVYDSSGRPVPSDKWAFLVNLSASGYYNRVQIDSTTFNKNVTYYVEYQSVDRGVLDEMMFDGVREMLLVGDAEGQNKYVEFTDYRVVTSLVGSTVDPDACTADTDNTFYASTIVPAALVPAPAPGAGSVALNAATNYIGGYNRKYVLECVAVNGGVSADFSLTVTNYSGGNAQTPNVPYVPAATTSIFRRIFADPATAFSLSNPASVGVLSGYLTTNPLPNFFGSDGIVLDIDAAFIGGDVGITWTWMAYGPGKVEFASAHDNTNQYSTVLDPVELGDIDPALAATAQTSGGKITVHADTDFSDTLDRSYFLHCSASGGAVPNRTATITWAGYKELPYTTGSIGLVEGTPASYQRVLLENGIYLTFAFGTSHNLVDTTNVLASPAASTLSSAITLANEIRTEYGEHDNNTGGAWHVAGSGAHQIVAAASADLATLRTLALDIQTKYSAHLADTTEHVVVDAIWTLDTDLTITAASDLAALVNFLNDVRTKYTRHGVANGFDLADTWRVDAKAARREFTGKDDRTVTLTFSAPVAATSVTATYTSSTLEGGWATETISDYSDPWFDLPDNIRLMVRNLQGFTSNPGPPLIPNTHERYAANDVFTFATLNHDEIDWSLVNRASETTDSSDIRQDTLGTITGTPLYFYLVLQETPETVLRVKDAATLLPISYTWISDTPYIAFASDPTVDVIVDYEYRGNEPDPGNAYYITANRIRIDSGSENEYEIPRRFLNHDASRLGLYPAETNNHLWLGSETMWDARPFGIYCVQVKSAAGDDTFTTTDYRRGIDATETSNAITDVIPLSHFAVIPYAKTSIENMNNPFEAKERLLWVGAQVGTQVGDESTANTLVYYARRTLQCSPSSPGKGNIILIGNNEATRTYALEDGSATTVTLDGSYIAAYTAALVASFLNPSDTIGRKSVSSFDTITTFNEKELVLLGQASITSLDSIGTGIYQYVESVTVDTTELALNEISARTQAHYVVKYVRQKMDETLTYLVPPSPLAGVAIITNQLVLCLSGLVASGVIAPYGSDTNPPTIRQINPDQDVYVFADEIEKTKYHFWYYFNARYPIKRLFGLYSVDTKFWQTQSAGQ